MQKKIILFEFSAPQCYIATRSELDTGTLHKIDKQNQNELGYHQREEILIESEEKLKEIQTDYKRNPYRANPNEKKIIGDVTKKIEDLLKSKKLPSDYAFVFVDMREEKIGYSLAAIKPGGKTGDLVFKENDVVCIYCGELKQMDDVTDNSQMARGFKHQEFLFEPATSRGISSYIQHAPTRIGKSSIEQMLAFQKKSTGDQNIDINDLRKDYDLYSVNFKKDVKPATANVYEYYLTIDHSTYGKIPLIVCLADRDIYHGQLLLANYGPGFSIEHRDKFFTEEGQIIPTNAYKRTWGYLNFHDNTYWGPLTKLVVEAITGEESRISLQDHYSRYPFSVSKDQLRKQLIKVNAMADVSKNSEETKTKSTDHDASPTESKLTKTPPATPKPTATTVSDPGKQIRNAAYAGDEKSLQLLLQKFSHAIDSKDDKEKGYTALHWAMEKEHLSCVKLLLAANANLEILNRAEKRPSELASVKFLSALGLNNEAEAKLATTLALIGLIPKGKSPSPELLSEFGVNKKDKLKISPTLASQGLLPERKPTPTKPKKNCNDRIKELGSWCLVS